MFEFLVALAYLCTGLILSLISAYVQGKVGWNFTKFGLVPMLEIVFWPIVYSIFLPGAFILATIIEMCENREDPWTKLREAGKNSKN